MDFRHIDAFRALMLTRTTTRAAQVIGASQSGIVKCEAQRADQVQHGAGIRTQANHVAGVRRDLGAEQDDMQHPRIIACSDTVAPNTFFNRFARRLQPGRRGHTTPSGGSAQLVGAVSRIEPRL